VYRAARDGQPAAATIWLDPASARALAGGPVITLDEDQMEARLVRTFSAGAEVSGRVEALIEFADPEGRFPLGASLTARFATRESQPSLSVPKSAVIHGAAGSIVFARTGGHFSRVTVTTGAETDGWIEITDGLYEGDVVVTAAVEALWLIELCALKGGTPCCPVPES
jgi:multidrug efflux pump subunit AcrA (membrane-fusion protein)